jgi:FkbM family methyltransferase
MAQRSDAVLGVAICSLVVLLAVLGVVVYGQVRNDGSGSSGSSGTSGASGSSDSSSAIRNVAAGAPSDDAVTRAFGDLTGVKTTAVYNKHYHGFMHCFNNNDHVCGEILNRDMWEAHFTPFFKQLVGDDAGTILDCGAFVGSHTRTLASLFPRATVVSFEMMPEHYKLLLDNVQLSGLSNIVTVHGALGATPGMVPLPEVKYDASSTNFGATFLDPASGLPTKAARRHVPMVTLDGMVLPMGTRPVTFIKMDVEGFELQALEGGQKLIQRDRPTMIVEIWPHKLRDFKASPMWKRMTEMGYTMTKLAHHDYVLKCGKHA